MEPAKKAEAAEKPKRQVKWGVLALAGVAAFPVLLALGADIYNNASFGMKTLGVGGAMVAGGFGLLVGLLPIMAHVMGASWRIRVAQVAFSVVTIIFAVMAYGENQGAHQGAKQAANISLVEAEEARREAREARAEAAKINETMSVAALTGFEADARKAYGDAQKAAETNKLECTRYKKCREARAALADATKRLGEAQTKADALSRAERADTKVRSAKSEASSTGSAEVNASAAKFAMWLGVNGRDMEADIAFATMIAVIVATILASVIGEDLTAMVARAIKGDTPPAPKAPRTPKKTASAAAAEMGQKEKLEAFLDKCTAAAPDGPLVGKDKFMVAMTDYWRAHHANEVLPTGKALGTAMGTRYQRGKDSKTNKVGYFARIDYRLSLVGKVA